MDRCVATETSPHVFLNKIVMNEGLFFGNAHMQKELDQKNLGGKDINQFWWANLFNARKVSKALQNKIGGWKSLITHSSNLSS